MSGIIEEISSLVKKYNVTPDRVQKSIAYLTHYGYLAKNKELTVADVFTAVEQFIAFFNLEPHQDILTPKVLKLMELPRCGHPDVQDVSSGLPSWGTHSLKYFIANRVTGLAPNVFDGIIAQAFANWAAVTNLTFTQVTSQVEANLVIGTGSGAKDNFPSLGVLGWAQLPGNPNYSGQLLMEFDNDEHWTTDPSQPGILILNVGGHELGHLLGLQHTSVPGSLLNPYYAASISIPQADDIQKIQALYGPPIVTPPVNPPAPAPIPSPTPTSPTVNELQLTVTQNPDGGFHFTIPGFRVMKV